MMYVLFSTSDGTDVAIEFDAAAAGWSELAKAFVYSLNKCSDLTRRPQVVPDIPLGCIRLKPKAMRQWLVQAGVPF